MEKLIFSKPDYRLSAHVVRVNDNVSIKLTTVWPQARTDRSSHTVLNITLPADSVRDFAALLLEHSKL